MREKIQIIDGMGKFYFLYLWNLYDYHDHVVHTESAARIWFTLYNLIKCEILFKIQIYLSCS